MVWVHLLPCSSRPRACLGPSASAEDTAAARDATCFLESSTAAGACCRSLGPRRICLAVAAVLTGDRGPSHGKEARRGPCGRQQQSESSHGWRSVRLHAASRREVCVFAGTGVARRAARRMDPCRPLIEVDSAPSAGRGRERRRLARRLDRPAERATALRTRI